MPSSERERAKGDATTRARRIRRATVTAGLTLALAGAIFLANRGAILAVQDGQGFARTVPVATLWRDFFARLPRDVPGILGPGPLAAGLVVATLALAYILVATLRLPE